MALQEYKALFRNGQRIGGIYQDGNLVWPTYNKYAEPFYVKNITNASETLIIKKTANDAPTLTIQYSTDKSNWTPFENPTSTTAITLDLQPGDKVYLRCNTLSWSNTAAHRNIIQGVSKVGGNIMSLLYGSNFNGNETLFPTGSEHTFRGLIRSNTNLIDASKLILPAENLITSCYQSMFQDCTSLTKAPLLPALNLAQSCYQSIFQGCISLVQVPSLPAITMANSCYQAMFRGCTLLTSAPTLHAMALDVKCYYQMFYGCSSLNEIKCTATSISATDATYQWTTNVSSTGTFVKKAGVTWPTGNNGIPSGWTVVEE